MSFDDIVHENSVK